MTSLIPDRKYKIWLYKRTSIFNVNELKYPNTINQWVELAAINNYLILVWGCIELNVEFDLILLQDSYSFSFVFWLSHTCNEALIVIATVFSFQHVTLLIKYCRSMRNVKCKIWTITCRKKGCSVRHEARENIVADLTGLYFRTSQSAVTLVFNVTSISNDIAIRLSCFYKVQNLPKRRVIKCVFVLVRNRRIIISSVVVAGNVLGFTLKSDFDDNLFFSKCVGTDLTG